MVTEDGLQYIDAMLGELSVGGRRKKTPCHPQLVKKVESPALEGEDATRYRSVIEGLLYLAPERVDCQYAIGVLAGAMAEPHEHHLVCLKRLLGYMSMANCGRESPRPR